MNDFLNSKFVFLGAIVITVPDSKKKLAMSLDTRP
jgi:hypothetical protein